MKRLLLIIALVLLGVLALVEQSERWTYSLWRALDCVPKAEALAHAGAPEPIAHAAGVVEGHVYTNSREALERALRDGYRFVELDLRKTIGGDYFAAHRYREFYEMTGGATFTFLPPTRKRVEESLLHGSLHPLFLEDACRILREKDAWLVTDKARDFGALLKACPMPERMIVEVSSLNQYFAALDAGIRYPALNTHRIAEAQRRQDSRRHARNLRQGRGARRLPPGGRKPSRRLERTLLGIQSAFRTSGHLGLHGPVLAQARRKMKTVFCKMPQPYECGNVR